MKLFRSIGGALSLALLLGLLVTSVPANAQTLTAMSLERSIALNNVLTTITPAGISPAALAAIAAGSLEIREQANFNSQANTLTSNTFVVPTGAPNPTNLSQLPVASFVASTTMAIDRIYITSTPYNSVMFVGSISTSTNTPYGNYLGAAATFSFGFTSDKPPKINNVIETVAGAIVVYSPSSSGTFTISSPSGGGGGTNTGITISINGVTGTTPTLNTTTNQIILDASQSSSSVGGRLTYIWSVVNGSASISFPNGNSAVANVQLGSGKLAYTLNLKIIDSTGATSSATITINFI